MKYSVIIEREALKQLQKMEKETQRRIISWIKENLVDCEDPRKYGKPLKGTIKTSGDTEWEITE